MLGRHARPCESFLVCIDDSGLFFVAFRACFCAFVPVCFRGFEWVSSRISLRETWIDVLCIFVLDLVPSNAGKPLRFVSYRSVL
jgi:hypothetical protein